MMAHDSARAVLAELRAVSQVRDASGDFIGMHGSIAEQFHAMESPINFADSLLQAVKLDADREARLKFRTVSSTHVWDLRSGSSSAETALQPVAHARREAAEGEDERPRATVVQHFTMGTAAWIFEPRHVPSRRTRRSAQSSNNEPTPDSSVRTWDKGRPRSLLTSGLRKAQRDEDQNGGKPVSAELANLRAAFARGSARLHLKVFFPKGSFVRLEVADSTTIDEVIALALAQRALSLVDSINKPNLQSSPRAFLLRAAEDDGSPDDDMPALVREQNIGGFAGFTTFVLCPNPDFKPDELLAPVAENDADPTTRRLLRVSIVDTKRTVTLAYNPLMTLQEVFDSMSVKHRLPPPPLGFQYSDAGDGEIDILPLSVRLESLREESSDLKLIRFKRRKSLGSESDSSKHSDGWDSLQDWTEDGRLVAKSVSSGSQGRRSRRSSVYPGSRRETPMALTRSASFGVIRDEQLAIGITRVSPKQRRLQKSYTSSTCLPRAKSTGDSGSFRSLPPPERPPLLADKIVFTPEAAAQEQTYAVLRTGKLGKRSLLCQIGGDLITLRPVSSAEDKVKEGTSIHISDVEHVEVLGGGAFALKLSTSSKAKKYTSSHTEEIAAQIEFLMKQKDRASSDGPA